MKNKIRMLCPYFGKLVTPSFKIWLKSCEFNSFIDFLIFSDDHRLESLTLPENVTFVYMTWDDCKAQIQKALGRTVNFVYAYKLCDMKPCYGLIFQDYLKDCEFWGHCDISDTVLGDLRVYLTDEVLQVYDKIGVFGHMSLYRNTEENNLRFQLRSKSGMPFDEVLSREQATGFDEYWHDHSINTIFKEQGFPLYDIPGNIMADILPEHFQFCLKLRRDENGNFPPRVFEWIDGKVFSHYVINGQVLTEEYGYLHFQKRKLENHTGENCSHFYIVPNQFIEIDHDPTAQEIISFSREKFYFAPIREACKRYKFYLTHPKSLKRRLGL